MRLLVFVSITLSGFAQTTPVGLPSVAVVIEMQHVKADRAIALWMITPGKIEMDPSQEK